MKTIEMDQELFTGDEIEKVEVFRDAVTVFYGFHHSDSLTFTKLELMLMVDAINEAILISDGRKVISRLIGE